MESQRTAQINQNGLKRKASNEKEIESDYDIMLSSVSEKAAKENRAEMIKNVLSTAVSFHHQKYLDNLKELPRTVIGGSQSSGKSTLFNSLISSITGLCVNVAPTAKGKMTTRPLDVSMCVSSGPTFELRMPKRELFTSENAIDVQGKLIGYYENNVDISVVLRDACALKIASNDTYRILDFPGPRTDGKDGLADYFMNITEVDKNGSPVVVLAVSGKKLDGDIGSEVLFDAFKNCVRLNPGLWNEATLFIVVTCADYIIEENFQMTAVNSANSMLASLSQEFPKLKVKFGIVQLVSEGAKSYKEVRQAEMIALSADRIITEARTESGEPLFILGIDNLKDGLIENLGKTISEDRDFLQSLSSALHEQDRIVTTQLNVTRHAKSLSMITSDIILKLREVPGNSGSKVDCARELKMCMREVIEERYANYWKGIIVQPTVNVDPYDEAALPEGVLAMEADRIWRTIMSDLLDQLASEESRVMKPLMDIFSRRIQSQFVPYKEFKSAHIKLVEAFKAFGTEKSGAFHENIRQTFLKSKFFIEYAYEKNSNAIRSGWPEDSKFIQDAGLDSDIPSLVRRTLKALVPMLRGLVTPIICERFYFEETFYEHLQSTFAADNIIIEEMGETRKKELETLKERYTKAITHTKALLRELPTVVIEKTQDEQEPPVKMQRVVRVFNSLTSIFKNNKSNA